VFSCWDGLLASELDDILGGTANVDWVKANFYDLLAAGTYVGTAGTYDTAGYITYQLGNGNFASWDLGLGVVSASVCGVDTAPWVQGAKDAIDQLFAGDGAVIGLGGALYGLKYVGASHTATGGWCNGKDMDQMAALLAAQQITSSGGFTWDPNFMDPGNEATQDTTYAILALNEFDGYWDEIAAAVH
jgi:hypothetical protein